MNNNVIKLIFFTIKDPKSHMKILISVEKKNDNILATCVQNYRKTTPSIKLQLYKLENNVNIYKNIYRCCNFLTI